MEQCDLIKARPNGISGEVSVNLLPANDSPSSIRPIVKGIAHGNSISKNGLADAHHMAGRWKDGEVG